MLRFVSIVFVYVVKVCVLCLIWYFVSMILVCMIFGLILEFNCVLSLWWRSFCVFCVVLFVKMVFLEILSFFFLVCGVLVVGLFVWLMVLKCLLLCVLCFSFVSENVVGWVLGNIVCKVVWLLVLIFLICYVLGWRLFFMFMNFIVLLLGILVRMLCVFCVLLFLDVWLNGCVVLLFDS